MMNSRCSSSVSVSVSASASRRTAVVSWSQQQQQLRLRLGRPRQAPQQQQQLQQQQSLLQLPRRRFGERRVWDVTQHHQHHHQYQQYQQYHQYHGQMASATRSLCSASSSASLSASGVLPRQPCGPLGVARITMHGIQSRTPHWNGSRAFTTDQQAIPPPSPIPTTTTTTNTTTTTIQSQVEEILRIADVIVASEYDKGHDVERDAAQLLFATRTSSFAPALLLEAIKADSNDDDDDDVADDDAAAATPTNTPPNTAATTPTNTPPNTAAATDDADDMVYQAFLRITWKAVSYNAAQPVLALWLAERAHQFNYVFHKQLYEQLLLLAASEDQPRTSRMVALLDGAFRCTDKPLDVPLFFGDAMRKLISRRLYEEAGNVLSALLNDYNVRSLPLDCIIDLLSDFQETLKGLDEKEQDEWDHDPPYAAVKLLAILEGMTELDTDQDRQSSTSSLSPKQHSRSTLNGTLSEMLTQLLQDCRATAKKNRMIAVIAAALSLSSTSTGTIFINLNDNDNDIDSDTNSSSNTSNDDNDDAEDDDDKDDDDDDDDEDAEDDDDDEDDEGDDTEGDDTEGDDTEDDDTEGDDTEGDDTEDDDDDDDDDDDEMWHQIVYSESGRIERLYSTRPKHWNIPDVLDQLIELNNNSNNNNNDTNEPVSYSRDYEAALLEQLEEEDLLDDDFDLDSNYADDD